MPRIPEIDINSPGGQLRQRIIKEKNLSTDEVAKKLKISRQTFSLILNNNCSITPEMASRMERVFGEDPIEWLMLQAKYDLLQVKGKIDTLGLKVYKHE